MTKTSYKFQIQILRIFQDYNVSDFLDSTVADMLNEAFDLNSLKFVLGHVKKDATFGPKFDLKGKEAKIAVRRIIAKTIAAKLVLQTNELGFNGKQTAQVLQDLTSWAVGEATSKLTFNDILNGNTETEDIVTAIKNKLLKLREMLVKGEGNKKSIQSMISKYKAKLKALGAIKEENTDKPTTGDVAKKIIAKIASLKEMLAKGEGNKKSIQSMISKYNAKLKALGIEPENNEEVAKQEKIATIKARLEQLELDLSLAPENKVKSVKSMISKLRSKLRELAPEELDSNNDNDFVITLTEVKEYIEGFEFDQTKQYQKEIIRCIKECSAEYGVKVVDVVEIVSNESNIFSDNIFGTYDDNNTDGTALTWLVAQIIEDTTINDLIAVGKSSMKKVLTIEEIFGLTTDDDNIIYPDVDSQSIPEKKLKAYAKIYANDPDKARKATKKRAELNKINDIDEELDTIMNGNEPIQNLV